VQTLSSQLLIAKSEARPAPEARENYQEFPEAQFVVPADIASHSARPIAAHDIF
jgi:hypothetical protein